jgi:hypothetical protein
MFKFNKNIELLAYNHLLVITFFLAVNFYFYYFNKEEHYTGTIETPLDVLYFTTTTHSSTGYGDILPKSQLARFFVTLHQLAMTALMIQIIYCFTCTS